MDVGDVNTLWIGMLIFSFVIVLPIAFLTTKSKGKWNGYDISNIKKSKSYRYKPSKPFNDGSGHVYDSNGKRIK